MRLGEALPVSSFYSLNLVLFDCCFIWGGGGLWYPVARVRHFPNKNIFPLEIDLKAQTIERVVRCLIELAVSNCEQQTSSSGWVLIR